EGSMDLSHLQRHSNSYQPNEGFMLRWDWIGCIPINFQKMQINFGIFRKGDNFYTYRDTGNFPTEQESYRSNKCIFMQKEIMRDFQPFPDTVLYCEFWGFSQEILGINGKPQVFGWTLHEIFDYNGQLLPGKYRLPFYSKEYDPNLLFQDGLPYLSNSALFIRVCLPLDPYLDVDSAVLLQNEYKIPPCHLRQKKVINLMENKLNIEKVCFFYSILVNTNGSDDLIGWIIPPIFKISGNDKIVVNSGIHTINLYKKPAQKPPFLEKKEKTDIKITYEINFQGGDKIEANQNRLQTNIVTQQISEDQNIDDKIQIKLKDTNEEQFLNDQKKLVIEFYELTKYSTVKNDLEYKIEIFKDNEILTDENNHKCIEQNEIQVIEKQPLVWKLDSRLLIQICYQGEIISDDQGEKISFSGNIVNNVKDQLEFNEQYNIQLDVQKLKNDQSKKPDQYFLVVILYLEDISKPFLWYYFNIFENMNLKQGLFKQQMFQKNFIIQDPNLIPKSDSFIEFSIKLGIDDE
ncbi:hypothetical protein IMG5_091790, partial [Ichthyophthirius multifiliis]